MFTKVVELLNSEGLVSLNLQYIDGSKIESVNDRLTYLPQESVTEMAALNENFAATPCEKDDAIKRFNAFCNNLQAYYDDNRGKLIWDDLKFEICLYNTTSGKGVGEGELVTSRIISYLCE